MEAISFAPWKQSPTASCPKWLSVTMVYDASIDVYVPIAYVLATSKSEATCANTLYWLQAAINFKLKPRTVTCDFEIALITSVTKAFPTTAVVGCLFHWKQAIRRKLIDLRITKEVVSAAMRRGIIDMLTVIPINEITSLGIPYVRSKIDQKGSKKAWNTFCTYFAHTWMAKCEASWWNVNDMMLGPDDIKIRTNNPVESYNFHYQQFFKSAHPNPYVWLQVTETEALRVMEMVKQVRLCVRGPPVHI